MKKLLKILGDFFNGGIQPNPPTPKRRYLKDVKPNELVTIEWYRFQGGTSKLRCVNNDPETRKIWLEINWTNAPKEQLILDYRDDKLANFHLLNEVINPSKQDREEEFDLPTLHKKMNEAIDKEEYERAEEYQKKIDKLMKK